MWTDRLWLQCFHSIGSSLESLGELIPSICFLLRFHSKVRYRVYKSLFSSSCQILKFTSCISTLHINIALIAHFLQNKLHDENGSFIPMSTAFRMWILTLKSGCLPVPYLKSRMLRYTKSEFCCFAYSLSLWEEQRSNTTYRDNDSSSQRLWFISSTIQSGIEELPSKQ
jgi:hypothetical protein